MRLLFLIFLVFANTDSQAQSKVTGSELIKSKFNLINHLNKPVTEKDFYGKYMLVFFGFSNCKSICPTGLSTLVAIVNKLEVPEDKVTLVFITIDPERDSPERLASFVKLFDPKLIGLTGDLKETDAVAKSFRAYYGKTEIGDDGSYSFDHSSVIYMIGKRGEYISHFSSTIGVEEIANKVRNIINSH